MKNSNTVSLVANDTGLAGSLTTLLGSEVADAVLVLAKRLSAENGSNTDDKGNSNLLVMAQKFYEARRERDEIFPPELFSDPAWDILLAAYWLPATGVDLTVGKLLVASASPKTTAWRWLDRLTAAGLLESRRSATDRRSAHVSLSPTGRNKVEAYLQNIADRHFRVGHEKDPN